MSTEAEKRFKIIAAHRLLHADAAKQVARLERLINESSDPEQIVEVSRELAVSHKAIEIFEKHMEKNHTPPAQPEQTADESENQQAHMPNEKNRQAIAKQIKKLTEARGSVPLAAPPSPKNPVVSAERSGGKRKNHGNTGKEKKDLYGDK
jgi:hypothetical protein